MTMTLWLRFFVYYCRLIVMPLRSSNAKILVYITDVKHLQLMSVRGDTGLCDTGLKTLRRAGTLSLCRWG